MVDPVSSAIEILPLVGNVPIPVYRRLAMRIATDNVLFLLVVQVLGSEILRFFGLSLPIVEISGGIVICGLGWAMLHKPDADGKSEVANQTGAPDGTIIAAARSCPVKAITVVNEDTGEQLFPPPKK